MINQNYFQVFSNLIIDMSEISKNILVGICADNHIKTFDSENK